MPGGQITQLLAAAGSGDRRATERLYGFVYAELHRLARSNLRRERAGHTLQPTALVNEAYLRLAPGADPWQNRRHFFHAAARAMRQILVDHARRRDAAKRGGGAERVTLSDGLDVAAPEQEVDVLRLDAALDELAAEEPRLAELVTLRFFGGLSIEDAAAALDVSPATAKRDWAFARAWLRTRLDDAAAT